MLALFGAPTSVHRPDGMDDVLGWKPKSQRDGSVACFYRCDLCTGSREFGRPGGFKDRAANAAPHRKVGIGSVDNCINLHPGNVLPDDCKRHNATSNDTLFLSVRAGNPLTSHPFAAPGNFRTAAAVPLSRRAACPTRAPAPLPHSIRPAARRYTRSSQSASRKPTSTKPSPTSRGRLTSMPSEASRASCCCRSRAGNASLRPRRR